MLASALKGPVKQFFHRHCSEFLHYCAENSLKVDIAEELEETSRDISLVQGRWIREDYTVKDEWVRNICLALKVQVPKIDAFASRENRRMVEFWTDAFNQDWSGLFLWITRPFSCWMRLLKNNHHGCSSRADNA